MSEAQIKNVLTEAEAAASNAAENPGAEPAVQAPAVKKRAVKTRAEQIAAIDEQVTKLTERRNELVAEGEREEQLKNIGAGTVVSFEHGRGNTRRTLSGSVITAYDDGKGVRKVKVLAGEGADANLYDVEVSRLSVEGAATVEV